MTTRSGNAERSTVCRSTLLVTPAPRFLLPAPAPTAAKFQVETDLGCVDGGLFTERERHAGRSTAGDRVGAEVEVQIFGLERQPRVEGVFETAAGGPAVAGLARRSR